MKKGIAADLHAKFSEDILEIIDNLDEAIAVYDDEDRLIFFNQAFLTINPNAAEFLEKGLTYEDGIRMDVELGKVNEARGREEEFIRQRVQDHQNPKPGVTVRDYEDGRRLLIKEAKIKNGGIVLTINPATDLRGAEEKLRFSEQRYEAITTNLPGVIYQRVMRPDGSISYPFVSPGIRELFGLNPDVVVADSKIMLSVLHPDEKERFNESLDESAHHLTSWNLEFRVITAAGEAKWIRGSSDTRRADNGDVIWDGFLLDITKRKLAEEALRNISETAIDAIITINTDSEILSWNAAATRIFGHAAEDAIGRPLYLIIPEHLHHSHGEGIARITGGGDGRILGKTVEIEGLRKSGEIFPVEISLATWVGENSRIFSGILRDITERKQAEEELTRKEAQLRVALTHMPGGLVLYDRDLNYVLFNSRYSELHDYPEGFLKVGTSMVDELRFQAERGDFGPGNKDEHVEQVLAVYRSEKAANWERTFPSGRTLRFDVAPTPEGGYIKIVTEITKRTRVEEALKESEERFRDLIEGSIQGVLIHDGNRPLFANQAYAEIFGYESPEKILAQASPFGHVAPHERKRIKAYSKARLGGGEAPADYEFEGVRKDGSPIWLENLVRMVSWNGRPAVQRTVIDITERKLAEAELRKLSSAVEQSPISIVITDKDGNIEYANPAFTKVSGYTLEDAIGNTPRILKSGTHPKKFYEELWKTITSGKIWSGEIQNKKKNGEFYWESASISPIHSKDGQIINFVGVKEDITQRKELEISLRDAKDEAENANAAKSLFLANMSHELRTPLNAVIGYSELLLETAEEEGWNDAVSDLAKIQASGKHLLSLINNVLDLSKIEAGKMDLFLETFGVKEMIDEVASTIQPLADQNSNAFEVRCPDDIGEMHSDLVKVRQTLFNLLSNACKFTDGGSVSLEVSRHGDGAGDSLRFTVADTGIGMSASEAESVFEEFMQADSGTSQKYGGTGLGLAITHRFCKMLGGGVTMKSAIGEGSTFVVELPADSKASMLGLPAVDIDEPLEAGDAEGRPVVLVIDDDPLVRDLLRRHLRRHGYHVLTAEGGDEGLRLARENHPDAITLDVVMPKMDGWAVLTALKDDPELAEIPVIMLTIVENRNLGFSLGAADYLAKPINKEKLIGILERHCPTESRATVMVVEDDEPTRRKMRLILEKEGCRVIEAEHGVVGLDYLADAIPDLIVLDLMMPEMDGFEFLSRLGENEAWRRIPVVVMTAKKLTPSDRKRLEKGADLLLQKGEDDLQSLLPALKELIATAAAPAPLTEESLAARTPPKAKPPARARQDSQVPIIHGSAAVAGRALKTGHILVVDDLETDRDLLARQLVNDGHTVSCADGGLQALAMADREPIDVILLDLMMPDLNGFEVLARLKADGRTESIPVIMISAYDEQEKAIQCLEIGAEDYLAKPVNVVLLRVRINSCIERKHAQDREKTYLAQIGLEKKNSEELLLNILPSQIIKRINAGEKLIADSFEAVTVLFSDLVNFTALSSQMEASELIKDLNSLFSRFDSLAKELGVEKVKTIGDAYMLVAGIPDPMPGHMEACADMAIGMIAALEEINPTLSKPFKIRIGLHTGPVVAGIIGHHTYVYDVWGTTVNHASRYESYSLPGHIHISEQLARPLMDKFDCQSRGVLEMRSIGEVETFFLKGRR